MISFHSFLKLMSEGASGRPSPEEVKANSDWWDKQINGSDEEMISLSDALDLIRKGSFEQAGQVRNAVAMQAMNGRRPEIDANACRRAFGERWDDSDEMRRHHQNVNIAPPMSGYWGD
jgi:hypothetical protein